MIDARHSHTASTLTNGQILVAGGMFFNGSLYDRHLNSAELYDSSTGLWTRTGNMSFARTIHTASTLTNGKVLVAGGYLYDLFTSNGSIRSAELYDPSTGLWTITGNMTDTRYYHTETALSNGRVLVAGGFSRNGNDPDTVLDSTELYDPSTGLWTNMGNMSCTRSFHTASILPTGKVLVAGGRTTIRENSSEHLRSAELYDPSTGIWTRTGDMTTTRFFHTATTLSDGKVLVAGGYDIYDSSYDRSSKTAEVFDPATGLWTQISDMTGRRYQHTANRLLDGKVLVTGGFSRSSSNTAEIYN
jgi:N-acetylneuraminic acid mutarotase